MRVVAAIPMAKPDILMKEKALFLKRFRNAILKKFLIIIFLSIVNGEL